MSITANIRRLQTEVPPGVTIVVAAKTREPGEIEEALQAGLTVIGENYVQEAERAIAGVTLPASWHFIGHLQKNKAGKAVSLFDMIETVDSMALAGEIDRRCALAGKTMPVLIEINSGREDGKAGIYPEQAYELATGLSTLEHIRVEGLMTMGPVTGTPEECRPFFRATRQLFEELKKAELPGVTMNHLSMGMSDSYLVAVDEGATMIRIGSGIFGARPVA